MGRSVATSVAGRTTGPNADGVYPDIPQYRVTLKRYSGQESTIPTISDNTDLIAIIKATAKPVLLDRSSNIIACLNGNDVTKTADGAAADLTNWEKQAMVQVGGIWYKYTYVASTNEKVFQFSPYKVRGYRYIRRRFLNMYGGYVHNDGETNYLVSISDRYTTQNLNIINFHQYAQNLGANYRLMATQDREVYRFYFWLIEQTFNSQSIINGVTGVSSAWWSAFDQSADGGQATYGQFHKTGITNPIAGHTGETEVTVNDGTEVTVNPYKWLWRENMLSGPYWVRESGYLFLGNMVYKAKDLTSIVIDGITSSNIADYYDYIGDINPSSGWILENIDDTLIPSLVGGSSTTGHSDYSYRPSLPGESTVYIPLGVGGAHNGSYLGVSALYSHHVPSYPGSTVGGALASDDPTDETEDGAIAG